MGATSPDNEACPDCHADFPPSEGPTHRYLGASPACWQVYGEVLAGQPAVTNPLVVDAYAAQHPGIEGPQAAQSVAIHLMTMEAVLRRGSSLDPVALRTRAVEIGRAGLVRYRWLDPRPASWPLTLADVIAGADEQTWIEGVLGAWRENHDATIDEWTLALLSRTSQ